MIMKVLYFARDEHLRPMRRHKRLKYMQAVHSSGQRIVFCSQINLSNQSMIRFIFSRPMWEKVLVQVQQ